MVSFLLTALLMGGCVAFIFAIKEWQKNEKEKQELKALTEEITFADQQLGQFISAFASLSISGANSGMLFIIRRFSMEEQHETLTKLNVSVAIKLTIARFLNSSVILVLTNPDPKNWFKGGSLAYDATILIVIMAIQTPFLYLANPTQIKKSITIWREKGKGEESKLTQREANTLYEGTEIDAANNISNYMVLIMTCIFYSPIIPLAIPLAFVGSFFNYWVYKYMLLRKHKMPEMFSDTMATFFSDFMPVVLIVWGLAFCIFVDRITKAYHTEFKTALESEVEYFSGWTET